MTKKTWLSRTNTEELDTDYDTIDETSSAIVLETKHDFVFDNTGLFENNKRDVRVVDSRST